MTYQLLNLRSHQLPQVYDIMCAQDFPNTPDTLEEALHHLQHNTVLGLYDKNHLQAAFILLGFTENAACLDVVCHPGAQGRWASRSTLKQLYQKVFERYDLDYIWAEPKNPTAMKACFQAGFQLLPNHDEDQPVMVLTRHSFAKLIHYKRN